MLQTLITILLMISIHVVYADNGESIKTCLSAREYITAYRYLEDHKEFSLNKKDIKELSKFISGGCTNSARRFIKVMDLMLATGFSGKKALEVSKKFSIRTDLETEGFIELFKKSYLKKYLDMDNLAALNIAIDLSSKIEGNEKRVIQTFNELVKFCLSDKGVGGAIKKCTKTAFIVTSSVKKFNKSLSREFIELFGFLMGDESKLPAFKALTLAETVIINGPTSLENFKEAYSFALSKNGLNYSATQAISFATEIAQKSYLETIGENNPR